MKITGSADLAPAPEDVFPRLLDPAVLIRCIPGCEKMELVSEGVYSTLVRAGVGPVKGEFVGEVTLSDVVDRESYRMAVAGKSAVGHANGAATIKLEATESGTRIHYAGDAQVAGLIASVGSRLLQSVANKIARDFFKSLAVEVAAESST